MKSIQIKAPAKINIGLNVISKRIDGFHNLETIFFPLNDLHDLLTFRLSDNFIFRCDCHGLETDSSNLVMKAVDLLQKYTSRKFALEIELKKNIPMGAGLGGGSSDAATTLVSLNELFNLRIEYDTLLQLALELGSDVPFFLRAKPAVGRSRGEILSLVDLQIEKPILVVNPGIHISTKKAFEYIIPKPSGVNLKELVKNNSIDFNICKDVITNDFEKYVFTSYPEIGAIKESMYMDKAEFALMSGSGSTVYGIFNSLNDAEKARSRFPGDYFTFINHPV